MVGEAAQIDLVRAVTAAGEADVGLARVARAVDDAADHRHGERRRDVLDALVAGRPNFVATKPQGADSYAEDPQKPKRARPTGRKT